MILFLKTEKLCYALFSIALTNLPEMAFYMVGDINEAIAKADELAKQVA